MEFQPLSLFNLGGFLCCRADVGRHSCRIDGNSSRIPAQIGRVLALSIFGIVRVRAVAFEMSHGSPRAGSSSCDHSRPHLPLEPRHSLSAKVRKFAHAPDFIPSDAYRGWTWPWARGDRNCRSPQAMGPRDSFMEMAVDSGLTSQIPSNATRLSDQLEN
jgi:hypothetical protein